MISLVIISNKIPLNLLIILTYYFVPDGLLFQYTKPYLSIVGNRFSYILLLKSAPAAILFVGKRSLSHLTAVQISTH